MENKNGGNDKVPLKADAVSIAMEALPFGDTSRVSQNAGANAMKMASPTITTTGSVDSSYSHAVKHSTWADEGIFVESFRISSAHYDRTKKTTCCLPILSKDGSSRDNFFLAVRVAVGVLICTLVQTRVQDYDALNGGDSTIVHKPVKYYVMFPEDYFLGGITYAAVAAILTAGKTLGETLQKAWQSFLGALLAVGCSGFVLYMDLINLNDLHRISLAFNGKEYSIGETDVLWCIAFIVSFTFILSISQLNETSKKFAIATTAFFILTVTNPTDAFNSSGTKDTTTELYSNINYFENFVIYAVLGFLGALVAILMMIVPYPLLATKRLLRLKKEIQEDTSILLDCVLDSYCERTENKSRDGQVLKLQLITNRSKQLGKKLDAVDKLLKDVWWEQAVGVTWIYGLRKTPLKQYIRMVLRLKERLDFMSLVLKDEQGVHSVADHSHVLLMKSLKGAIRQLEYSTGSLFQEIYSEALGHKTRLDLQGTSQVEQDITDVLIRYRSMIGEFYTNEQYLIVHEMEKNLTFNRFLFHFISFAECMAHFEADFNSKNYSLCHRVCNFFHTGLLLMVDRERYSSAHFRTAFKVTASVFLALIPAMFIFHFEATIPSTIIYVMGANIGGTFNTAFKRMVGIVAGSIFPSILKFLICAAVSTQCGAQYIHALSVLASSVLMFSWITASLFVHFSAGPRDGAVGLVSAYVAVNILMDPCDCQTLEASSSAVDSYSTLSQASIALVISFAVDTVIIPSSTSGLLISHMQDTLAALRKTGSSLLRGLITPRNLVKRSDSSTDDEEREANDEFNCVSETLRSYLPALFKAQKSLINEAFLVPKFMHPKLPKSFFEQSLNHAAELEKNMFLLFEVVEWRKERLSNKADGDSDAAHWNDDHTSRLKGLLQHWSKTLDETVAFFSCFLENHEVFTHSSRMEAKSDQLATFMLFKTAFLIVSGDLRGEINAVQLRDNLARYFGGEAKTSRSESREVDEFVQCFMRIADSDGNGHVTFEEFLTAMNRGMVIEMDFNHVERGAEEEDDDVRMTAEPHPVVNDSTGNPITANTTDTASQSTVSFSALSKVMKKLQKTRKLITARNSKLLNTRQNGQPVCTDLNCITQEFVTVFLEWLYDPTQFERMEIEEILVYSCFLCGVTGMTKQLNKLENTLLCVL